MNFAKFLRTPFFTEHLRATASETGNAQKLNNLNARILFDGGSQRTILAKANGKKYKNPYPQIQCSLYRYFCCFYVRFFAVDKILFSYLDILGLSQQKVFFSLKVFWDCRQQKVSLKNNKEKIFAVEIPRISK